MIAYESEGIAYKVLLCSQLYMNCENFLGEPKLGGQYNIYQF